MDARIKRTSRTVVTDPKPELTASVVFDILSNIRRRYILYYLREESEASTRELSRGLAAWENDVAVSAVTSKQRKRVYTALQQTHLPRLDEYGVVEFDRDRGRISETGRFAVFEPYLDRSEPTGRNWPRWYVGIGLMAVTLAVGIISGVPVLSSVEPGITALLVGTTLVLVAASQMVAESDRRIGPDFPDLEPRNWRKGLPADD